MTRKGYPQLGRKGDILASVDRLYREAYDIRTYPLYMGSVGPALDFWIGGYASTVPKLVVPRDRSWHWLQLSGGYLGTSETLTATLYVGGYSAGDVCFTATLTAPGVGTGGLIYSLTQSIVNSGKESMLAESTTWGVRIQTSAGVGWDTVLIELAYEDFTPNLTRAI